MAVECSSSWARRAALALTAGGLLALGGCVVAPVDPYYDIGAPVVYSGSAYAPYYGSPYYGPTYYSAPYYRPYLAPSVSLGFYGSFGGGRHWRGAPSRGNHHWRGNPGRGGRGGGKR